jgi:uncharacterized RDD family membrane protein YckC
MPGGLEPAGLLRRVGAIIVDWFASMLVVRLVFSSLPYPGNEFALATLLVFFAEVTLFTWLTGSSFGQRLFGIAVIREGGGRLGLPSFALRTLLICLVIPAVVYDSEGRGLQDKAVGSQVVLRRSIPRASSE